MKQSVVRKEEFKQDAAWSDYKTKVNPDIGKLIDGLLVTPLILRTDHRGTLIELLTQRNQIDDEIVHVYQVFCKPGSIRAWVYHQWQEDRLAYTNGDFRVVLYDIREDSPTYGMLNVLDVGDRLPCRIRIPAFVVHGVANLGSTEAHFVNMPTRAYDPANPDKSRIHYPDDRIPYTF